MLIFQVGDSTFNGYKTVCKFHHTKIHFLNVLLHFGQVQV